MRITRTNLVYCVCVFSFTSLVSFIILERFARRTRSLQIYSNNQILQVAVDQIQQKGNTFLISGQKYSDKDVLQSERTNLTLNLPENNLVKYELIKKDKLHISSFPQAMYFTKPWQNTEFDCQALLEGNKREQIISIQKMEEQRPIMTSSKFIQIAKNCDYFKIMGRYINHYLTEEERDFPIAFSIVTFNHTEQFHKLLRAIYRPQNFYCIHVDKKSDTFFKESVKAISECFTNVFLSSRSVDVQWGEFSVLEAELVCMEDLLQRGKWKYFINLTGQEYPLRTNYELVKILKSLQGANEMESTISRANDDRWSSAGTPPSGLKLVKGSVHITVNRMFVEYALHNNTAKSFLEWVRKTDFPDETFFATLNHNPQLGIPGSYKGEPETNMYTKPFITRFKNWGGEPFDWQCLGKRVRAICIFGVGDLPLLASRPELFANKFYIDYQPFALECMEELIFNRTRDEYFKRLEFDTTYYENLDIVQKKV